MTARRVLLVLATSAGGVGRHVAELATGLADGLTAQAGEPVLGSDPPEGSEASTRPGAEVLVAGPERPEAGPGAHGSFAFEPVDISDRPRPRADLRAVLKLRRLMRADHGEMVARKRSQGAERDQKTKISGGTVVHAHGLRAGALAGLATRLIRRRDRPVLVVTLHNALVSGGRIAVVHRLLELIVARTARVVLVVSADIGAAMRARGARDVRRAIVPAPPLPPPAKEPAEVRAELGIPDGVALLVTIARLAPQKGLDDLITAVAQLTQGVMAVIAGDGPLREQLQRQIDNHTAPVRLLGRRDDVPDLIAAADLVVLPSRWEGQPLVAQEALRAGAALVATDAGGTAAVTGKGARLVAPGDPAALAHAIAELLRDPAARVALRAAARATDLPTADDAAGQVAGLYREIGW